MDMESVGWSDISDLLLGRLSLSSLLLISQFGNSICCYGKPNPKNGNFRPHFQDSIAVRRSFPPVAPLWCNCWVWAHEEEILNDFCNDASSSEAHV